MTADECNDRAANCAANAALAQNQVMAQDFMRMAAQWRAMATQRMFLGCLEPLAFEPSVIDLSVQPRLT